jgi:hypothetical protein
MNYIVNIHTMGRIKKETFTEPAKAEHFYILMQSMGYRCTRTQKESPIITRQKVKIIKG